MYSGVWDPSFLSLSMVVYSYLITGIFSLLEVKKSIIMWYLGYFNFKSKGYTWVS